MNMINGIKYINIKRFFLSLLVVAILSTTWSYGKQTEAIAASADNQLPVEIPVFNIPEITQAQLDSDKPNILVVATGGTLAGRATNGATGFQSYAAGTYTMEKLLTDLPNEEKLADVNAFQFGNKGSGGYKIEDLYDLSLAVDQALTEYDGVVVTTGTDTMEEIAYFLDLTVQSEKPVVVTGAMRPWDVVGTDGPANLFQAIKTAASGKTKWFGTVIMLNDVIQAAREVTKSNTHRADTFETAMFGALGYVDDNAVRIYRLNGRASKAGTEAWKTPFDLTKIAKKDLPLVGIAYNYQEASGGQITGLVADGAKGIVTAGTGAGGISSGLTNARRAAISEGVVFVSTSRTDSGSVYSSGTGIISGDNLSPQHARIMLILSLAFTNDINVMKNWFATVGTQEIQITAKASKPDDDNGNESPGNGNESPGNGNETPPTDNNNGGSSPVNDQPTGTTNGTKVTVTPGSESKLSLNKLFIMLPGNITDSMTTISAQLKTWNKDNKPLTDVYEITSSSDASVQNPFKVSIKLDEKLLSEAEDLAIFYYDEKAEQWIELETSVKDGELTANTVHFGLYTVMEQYLPSFTDTSAHWAEKSIIKAVKAGIVQGYEDGSFKPNNKVSRSEYLVMIMRYIGIEEQDASLSFKDEDRIPTWAKASIAASVKLGIVTGYEDGTFQPDKDITRLELVIMAARAMKLDTSNVMNTGFADDSHIPSWAKGIVAAAVKAGIVNGKGNNQFDPNGTATRAEAIKIITNIIEMNQDK